MPYNSPKQLKNYKDRQTQEERKKMKSFIQAVLLLVLMLGRATSEGFLTIEAPYPEKEWCIADEQTPDDILQQALDWACGYGGADCKMIQPNKPCYLPNTVRDHASYAFNSYWQKFKNKGGSCYFNSAAMVTDLDPSHGPCRFKTLS